MRLRAIRVSDVGGFREPVAIEGMSGGLDVLLAPNETGKSTLFRAIETVFLRKHSARGPFLSRLAPHGGGTPLIEADFEIAGGTWRISKQYGQGKRALLKGLAGEASGSWRNADAESKLFELLGAGDGYPGRFGALWIGQRHGLGDVRLDHDPESGKKRDAGEANALVAAIEQEIADAAGGSLLAAVRAELMSRATRLLTDTLQRVRANGPLAQAQAACETLKAALGEAEAAAARTAAQRQRLEAIDGELAGLRAPDVVRAREGRIAELGGKIGEAEAASDRLKRLEAECRHAEGLASRADEQLARFAQAQGAARQLGDAAAQLDRRRDDLVARIEAAEEARAVAARRVAEVAERLAQRRGALEALERLHRLAALERERLRLAETRARVGDLEARIGDLNALIRDNPVTAGLLTQVRDAQAAFDIAEGRRDAAAPVIEIVYEAGREGAILLGGAPAAGGERIAVRAPLELTIPGVGAVRVAPGGGADLDAAEADLAAARQHLADRLAHAGAETAAAAVALAEARAAAEGEMRTAIATMNGLAPDGPRELDVRLSAVDGEIAQLRAAIEAAGVDAARRSGGSVPPVAGTLGPAAGEADGLRAGIAADEDALRIARDDERDAERAYNDIGRELDGVRFKREETVAKLREIDAVLGPADARDGELARLEAAAREAREAANTSRRNVVAVADTVIDEAAMSDLRDQLASLERQSEIARSRIRHLEYERIELVAHVSASDEAGASQRVGELAGELVRAQHVEAQLREEAEGLRLAIGAVDAAQRQSRDRFSAPVYEALQPYLAPLFPDGELVFGENFQPQALRRGARSEPFDFLSEGTQEQLSVLVRLAFGRVFAAAGQGVPVILDDPLAYADKQRLAQVFKSLQAASAHHQVIVFSCRSPAFDALGGHRLELNSWDADRDAQGAGARRLQA